MRALGPRLIPWLTGVMLTLVLGAGPARAAAPDPWDAEVVQTTSDLSDHMTRLPDLEFGAASTRGDPVIHVNDAVRMQKVGGFGAAVTDSSAWLISQDLSSPDAGSLISELFGPGGIHLNFVRIPIGASDFTKDGQPYTYDDLPVGQSDPTLADFSIAHDGAYVIPLLRQVLAANPQTQFLATPWSPPAWMKANDSLNNDHHHGTLLRSAAGPWADYFVKFIEAYAQAGIPIAAITPQNEPTNGTEYPGAELPATTEAIWTSKFLAPALSQADLRTRIYGHDWGWGPRATSYAKALTAQPGAKALSGLAWHCYFGAPYVMSTLHSIDPSLDQIVDECSPGITPFPTTEMVIGSMRNWAGTVALWNLALNLQGGPVQQPNTGCGSCTGLVTVNQQARTVNFGLNYFQLGQASAFVAPGAVRIGTEHFVVYAYKVPGVNPVTPGLDDVAFLNPDGSRVLLAYNNSSAPIRFAVQWHSRSLVYTVPGYATVTMVWRRAA